MIPLQRVSCRYHGVTAHRCRTVGGLFAGFVVALVASATAAQSPAMVSSAPGNAAKSNVEASVAAGPFQGLVRATTTQIQLAFRNNEEERAHRREQVAATIAAWRAAGRSAANDQLLTNWLREAIRKSMPGSREPLPELPKFVRAAVARPAATSTATPSMNSSPSSTMRQKPVVESADPARRPQSSQAAAKQSRSGVERSGRAADTAVTPSPTSSTQNAARAAQDAEQDFWSAHPANSDLPADLSGDPFRDDP
jgi:hypothetical protein